MKIGNRVRLLRGTEEGIVVALKENKIVEVEIEDGFVIPTLISEVVVIDKNENEKFPSFKKEIENSKSEKIYDQISPGLYLGLKEISGNQYQTYFINRLAETVLFSISQQDKKAIKGKAFGICESSNSKEIGVLSSSIFNSSKKLLVQLIFYSEQSQREIPPLSLELELDEKMLSVKKSVDSIVEELFMIKIEEKLLDEIDPNLLREKMFENNAKVNITTENKKQHAEQTIDLHIDSHSLKLKSNEILAHQLDEFEKAFDNALSSNADKLKIIHGIGAGILRSKIHKRLSSRKEIKFFEDADKEKFGFGSTIIYF